MSTTMVLYPVVEVWWHDAEAHNQWETLDAKRPMRAPKVRTVGMLIQDNADNLVVASSHSGDDVNARITIPRGMLISKKVLKKGSKAPIEIY